MPHPFWRFMKRLRWPGIALAGLILLAFAWGRFAPTKVVLVNFPDFQAARIAREASSSWMRVERRSTADLSAAHGAGLVIVFGRGLALNDAQRGALRKLAADTPVYVHSSTDPAMDVTNLAGPDLDAVSAYLDNGGASNYASLLAYVRHDIQQRRGGAPAQAPREIALDVLFHLGDEHIFESVDAFEHYAHEAGFMHDGAPRIALLTSVPGPFNSNREHVDALIEALMAKQWNVYPVAAFSGRLGMLKAINPDLVMYMPHGRLTLDQGAEATAWLHEQDIPVLTPMSVFQDEQEWREDAQGFSGPLLSMSLALPELDGAVAPFVVAAQQPDASGYQVFAPLPERMQRFVDLAERYLQLKQRPLAEQKVAIYYFKGPGMSALTAGDLEVSPSLYRLLSEMRQAGYDLGDLPATFAEFDARLQKQGRVLAPYATGEQAAFFTAADPARVSVAEYRNWCEKAGIRLNCQRVDERYGPAPGRYLVSREGEIGVARLQFGNVAVLPQPLAGIGEDTFKLVHGADAPPPHPYVASYLWARFGFEADAVMHFGTHGSLEFTPGKQVALSKADWSDALVGDLPHFYVYTMSNVGEAIIAKRRSYATIISHLTPPIREAGLHSELRQLGDALQALHGVDEAVAHEYRQSARALAQRSGLAADLDLPQSAWSQSEWRRLANHVERLRAERITIGLHTLGQAYSDQDQHNMLQLASAEAVAQALAELARHHGQLTPQQQDDEALFDQRFRQPARRMIAQRLGGADLDTVLQPVVDVRERERVRREHAELAGPSTAELIRNFVGMAQAGEQTSPQSSAKTAAVDVAQLQAWVVQALAVTEQKAFLAELASDKAFERASKTLDPAQLERARTIAKAIPPMARALEVATLPHIRSLMQAMQEPAVRSQVLALLDDATLADRVKAEAARRDAQTLAALEAESERLKGLQSLGRLDASQLRALADTLKRIGADQSIAARSDIPELASLADESRRQAMQQRVAAEQTGRAEKRRQYREAILRLEDAIESAPALAGGLDASPQAEIDGALRALRGGYISPSSGGDPVVSPAAIPVGRNMYAVDAEKTPSLAAERVGAQLGQALLDSHRARHDGAYPAKIAFTLWPGDFIQSEGAVIGEIFWLLGVEPIRDAFQRVVSVRPIPAEQLGRPRVDVVVQTAGQLRDLAASRLYLIEEAVRIAAAQPEPDNALKASVAATEARLKDAGYAPLEARKLATSRVFGGANGAYGTAIMGLVERGDQWRKAEEIANTYLSNMGASYGSADRWMAYSPELFAAVLTDTDALVQPRDSNTWGALSLDHVYEFMGGLSRAIHQVNGEQADAYFDDLRQPGRPRVTTLEETISIESRATVLNPDYLRGLAAGGSSSAGVLAETTRNAFGWEAMRPDAIPERFWNEFMEMVVRDRDNLGLQAFFARENPYALQEITAVMLETARKGLWQASAEQVAELARRHAENVAEFGPNCTDFTCGNARLRDYIEAALDAGPRAAYAGQIERQLLGDNAAGGVVLHKESAQNIADAAEPQGQEPQSADTSKTNRKRQVDSRIWGGVLAMLVLMIAAAWWRQRTRRAAFN